MNLETLMCTARDENITETAEEAEGKLKLILSHTLEYVAAPSGAVCGDDRKTYTSVCNLLQNSPDLQVMYAGNCNRTECSGNEVCIVLYVCMTKARSGYQRYLGGRAYRGIFCCPFRQ